VLCCFPSRASRASADFFYFLALKGDKVFRNVEKKLVIKGGINLFVKTALDNQL